MTKDQKNTLYILLILSFIYFVIFYFPNSVGSLDSNMVSVFEPDEAVQLSPTLRMVRPKGSLYEFLKKFFAYRHYFYGFPFFAYSAVLLFPFALSDSLSNTTLIMVILRQFVSVLPMLASIIILVYIQTKFRSTIKSLIIFIVLLSIPAVTKNSMWWHPESVVIFFIVLTLYFLDRDNLKFGNNFVFAAVACGFVVGTKLLGLFFFITIPTYIAIGYYRRTIDFRQAVKLAVVFVAVMFFALVVSNPLLLVGRVRDQYIRTQTFQAGKMSFGWEVAYQKGPSSWFGIIREFYGQWYFLLLAFASVVVGILRGENRLVNINILTWSIPFSIYILYVIAIKPTHFFLPIALPLFSSVLNLWPIKSESLKHGYKPLVFRTLGYISIILIGVQVYSNISWGVDSYVEALNRGKNSESIQFYYYLEENYLNQLPQDVKYKIYRDPRLYLEISERWKFSQTFAMLDHAYFEENDFDIILLMRQRILDYTHPDLVPADPENYPNVFEFYTDAEKGNIAGYLLMYENDFGLAFIKEDIYNQHIEGDNTK